MARTRALLLGFACALSGCLGDDEPESTRIEGDTLTIYSSLPLKGDSAEAARAVAAGQRHALADLGHRVGSHRLRLVQLDSSGDDGGGWDPARVSGNAHRAVEDETAIAYIGELEFGGSAVSLPITNDEGLLQVSPLDGLTSLTRRIPGNPREGPERYYPAERRTFLRLVPNDLRVAAAVTDLLEAEGAERLTVIYDEGIYGRELAAQVGRLARTRGIETSRPVEDRDERGESASLALKVAAERPDAVAYAGTPGTSFGGLLAGLRAELPGVPLFGGAGLAAGDQLIGAGRVAWVQPVRPREHYPGPGQALLRRLHHPPEAALYGYESIRLVAAAVRRGGPDRRAVVRSALSARRRDSVLGSYRVSTSGDVSEGRLALYEGGDFARLVR